MVGENVLEEIDLLCRAGVSARGIGSYLRADDMEAWRSQVQEDFNILSEGSGAGMNLDELLETISVNARPTAQPRVVAEPSNKEWKLEELTQALPMLGLRVRINPDKISNSTGMSRTEFRRLHEQGDIGKIVSLRGDESSAMRIISNYKKHGYASGWTVRVIFDSGYDTDINIEKMLPVFDKDEKMYKITLENGDEFTPQTEEDFYNKVNHYAIVKGYAIRDKAIVDHAYRQKMLEKA